MSRQQLGSLIFRSMSPLPPWRNDVTCGCPPQPRPRPRIVSVYISRRTKNWIKRCLMKMFRRAIMAKFITSQLYLSAEWHRGLQRQRSFILKHIWLCVKHIIIPKTLIKINFPNSRKCRIYENLGWIKANVILEHGNDIRKTNLWDGLSHFLNPGAKDNLPNFYAKF